MIKRILSFFDDAIEKYYKTVRGIYEIYKSFWNVIKSNNDNNLNVVNLLSTFFDFENS